MHLNLISDSTIFNFLTHKQNKYALSYLKSISRKYLPLIDKNFKLKQIKLIKRALSTQI